MKTTHFSAKIGVLLSLGALTLVVGCGKEEIKVYSVPKEIAAAPRMASSSQSEISADRHAPHLHWTTPGGWQQLAPTETRVGNFLVSNGDKKAEVSIIPLPGEIGTELDNVNRWRREINLSPITENDISSEKVSVGSDAGKLYDLAGADLQTLAVVLEKEGTSWFFKMRGDKEIVSQNKPAFVAFLKSIEFDFGSHGEHAEAPAAKPETSKKVETSASEPNVELPANWRETPPPAMVLRSFSVGENEHEAKITITAFPGSVGGVLANVNRWRGQLSLDPVDENGLAKLTQSIDVPGGKATLVDMTGTDGKTGKASRMIAAIVPRGEKTWFYKMMGDDATVAKEKESFVKFVKTAR